MDNTQLVLKRISDELGQVDFQNLKYLCHQKIPHGELEKATRPTDLFSLMQQRRFIKPGDLSFLETLLISAGRQDLALIIQTQLTDPTMETESASSSRPFLRMASGNSSDMAFRQLLHELGEELTRDNVESLKFMANLPASCSENIHSGREFFNALVQRGIIGPDSVQPIIDLFNVIHRRDLSGRLEAFSNKQQDQVPAPVLETSGLPTKPAVPSLTPSKKAAVSNMMLMRPADFTGPCSPEPRYPVQARNEIPDEGLAQQFNRIAVEDDVDAMPAYSSTKRPRGIALIISNEKFQEDNPAQLRDRNGTLCDEENLKDLWRKLHFKVVIEKNLRAFEIYNVIRNMSAKDHSNYDCFVCCLLSHGANGGIYGTDGELVEIREITAQFKGNACPSLGDKPKLFFIQACRGQDFDRGVQVEPDAVSRDAMKSSAEPNESHFLLGYATPPGYVSWRSQVHGSWYISKLCEVFSKYCERFDVTTMMVKVNDEVSEAFTKKGYKQCPAPVVTLRKRVLLNNN